MFANKKGLSPLIATVLLIAFAVAIGTMIMNWSAGVSSEGHSAMCEAISINSDAGACYNANQLVFEVRNDGNERVDAIRLFSSTTDAEQDITLKDSSLVVGERLEKTVAYLYSGGAVELEFTPLVQVGEELSSCPGAGFIQTTLPPCE